MGSWISSFALLVFSGGEHLTAQPTGTFADEIVLELSSSKNTFIKGEIIWFDVIITNSSVKDVTIPIPSQSYSLEIIVKNSKGETLAPHFGKGHWLGTIPTTVIRSRERRTTSVNLIGYGNSEEFTGVMQELLVDSYTVWARLGDARSNTMDFLIVEPTSMDRVVKESLNNVRALGMQSGGHGLIVDKCKELIKSYPETNYIWNLYYDLISFEVAQHFAASPQQVVSLALDVIDRFPDHGIANLAIGYLIHAYARTEGVDDLHVPNPSEQGRIENHMHKIKSKYPNKKVQSYIDERLELSKLEWNYGK